MYLTIYPSTHLSIDRSIYPSIDLSLSPSPSLSLSLVFVYTPIYLFTDRSIYLSTCLLEHEPRRRLEKQIAHEMETDDSRIEQLFFGTDKVFQILRLLVLQLNAVLKCTLVRQGWSNGGHRGFFSRECFWACQVGGETRDSSNFGRLVSGVISLTPTRLTSAVSNKTSNVLLWS